MNARMCEHRHSVNRLRHLGPWGADREVLQSDLDIDRPLHLTECKPDIDVASRSVERRLDVTVGKDLPLVTISVKVVTIIVDSETLSFSGSAASS